MYIVNIDVAGIGPKSLCCIINFIVMQMCITRIIAITVNKAVGVCARIFPSRGFDCSKKEKRNIVIYAPKGRRNLYIERDEITEF